jgi:hypothetical protein
MQRDYGPTRTSSTLYLGHQCASDFVATHRINGRVIVFAALPSVKLGLSEGADEEVVSRIFRTFGFG